MTREDGLPVEELQRAVETALAEDLAAGDATTDALISSDVSIAATIRCRAPGVVAGVPVAAAVFNVVDPTLAVRAVAAEGSLAAPGDLVMSVEGKAGGILNAERVALNFLQRLSGIATETRRYVNRVAGTNAVITDTRKTTPGLRALEKYAVRVGGGRNHRYNLSDGVLIKDNHLAVLRAGGLSLAQAIERARRNAPRTLKVEVEVESIAEAEEALKAGADIVMVDNMCVEDMRRVVEINAGRAAIEASGGVTLDNVLEVARTGVDLISVGALTHSARALDMSLSVEA
jgi:nicotinate-nucleotide pyrophosphorylase (carboxylating)